MLKSIVLMVNPIEFPVRQLSHVQSHPVCTSIIPLLCVVVEAVKMLVHHAINISLDLRNGNLSQH